MKDAILIGCGAIGRLLLARLRDDPAVRIAYLFERESRRLALQRELGTSVSVISDLDELPAPPACAIECAGHGAVSGVVVPLLGRGVDTAVVSIGSLADEGLAERLEAAARRGRAQLTLVAGAIGGIDALASARLGGLDEVIYTGRKPPRGWRGTPAEDLVDLTSLAAPAVIFEGSAREAARLYPKNANVAATVSLAGLGFDATQATLIADPAVTRNVHRVVAEGAFGKLDLQLEGEPLAANPKTSALTVFSVLRAIHNVSHPVSL